MNDINFRPGWICQRGMLMVSFCLGLVNPVPAATISITPSAVSSTFVGPLTMEISGLTNKEQVVVSHYLDLNTNGTVEQGEPIVERFRLTDGQSPMIGGVTNFGVLGDRNAATGAITAVIINYGLTLDIIVGQHLFLLSSPTERFGPVPALFIITNAPLSQSVAGSVYAGDSPVAHALVVALELPDFSFRAATIADTNGNYFLNLNPGAYGLVPALPGYYTDQEKAALVALTNGITATNRLYLTNGSATLSGTITNMANSNSVAGLFVKVESGSLFATAFTDIYGVYSAGVSRSYWQVKAEGDRLGRRNLVGLQAGLQFDLTAGSVTNANFGLPGANAMIYGRVTVASNAPLAIVSVSADDALHQYETRGFSSTNGGYFIPVLASTNSWHCGLSADNQAVLSNAIVSAGPPDILLATNQAFLLNFNILPATATISGRLQDRAGSPVDGVSIGGHATIGNADYDTKYTITDAAGNFSFAASDGTWTLYLNCCGSSGLDSRGLVDLFTHTVTIPPANPFINLTVYPVGTPAIFQPTRLPPSAFSFLIRGASNANYTVQVSTNLAGTNWMDLYSSALPSNLYLMTDQQATNSYRFYRIRKN